jgi:hypothetical protein
MIVYLKKGLRIIKSLGKCIIPVEKWYLYRENDKRFFKKMMDPSFNWKQYAHEYNPYYLKWGFKFPMYEFEYYAQNTGVKSDLYLPIRFYQRYIFPYLDHDTWHWGYADKNMFSRLLDIKDAQQYIDVLVPECVACCDNGRYFINGAEKSCTFNEVVEAVMHTNEDMIIKPSIQSSHGHGITKITSTDKKEDFVVNLIRQFGANFTIQKVIEQHPDLAKLNPTSVNTIRIATYQDFKGNVKVLYASQRFGGKGKIYDNADDPNGSGGFCAIESDGTLKREVHHYRNMKITYLDDDIMKKVPYFDKVKTAVLFLHTRFPNFALIGWDVTITTDGHPVIIEYNFQPGLGSCQLAHGPMFSKEDLDEIMGKVAEGRIVRRNKYVVDFPSKEKYWI